MGQYSRPESGAEVPVAEAATDQPPNRFPLKLTTPRLARCP
jgi:hypothetical protein